MGWLPVVLNLSGKRCLLVGGGRVAARKAKKILAAGARLSAVAPEFSAGFAELLETCGDRLTLLSRSYEPGEASGYDLVFAASDDPGANRMAGGDAEAAGRWANLASEPETGSFILPASFERGGIIAAVSTGGASPALAAALRDEMAAIVKPWHGVLAGAMAGARERLRLSGVPPAERAAAISALCEREILAELAAFGDAEGIAREILRRSGGERGEA